MKCDVYRKTAGAPSTDNTCCALCRPAPPLVSAVASTSAAKLQPQTGHLVVPCDNALLQFFDVIRDRHVAKLQVAPRNYVSVTSSSQTYSIYGPPTPPQITHTAFSRDGSSMVTVDVRPDAGNSRACVALPTNQCWCIMFT